MIEFIRKKMFSTHNEKTVQCKKKQNNVSITLFEIVFPFHQ